MPSPIETTTLLPQSVNDKVPEAILDARTESAKRKLQLACICSVCFMIAEVVGGYYAGSLAIMTDAAHLLSDVAGFLISLFALWVGSLPASSKMSYGFSRAEVIGAVVSVLFIWGLTGVLLYAAAERLHEDLGPNPQERVNGKWMFIVAFIGLCVNLLLMKILGHDHHHHGDHDHGHGHGHSHEHHNHHHHDEGENINVQAAYIHALGDFVQSLGVCIAGALIWYNPEWQIADPIATFMFSVLVLFTTMGVVKRSIHVLMEGTPEGVNPVEIEDGLRALPSVTTTHDLHIWSLTIGMPSLSVHVVSNDPDRALHEAQDYLISKGINHTTIQVEKETLAYPQNCVDSTCSRGSR